MLVKKITNLWVAVYPMRFTGSATLSYPYTAQLLEKAVLNKVLDFDEKMNL